MRYVDPTPKIAPSNVLICPQLKNTQFTITEEQRNKNIIKVTKPKNHTILTFLS